MEADRYRLDSHKLSYHVSRVAGWLAGGTVYPIYAEISPSGACNHRCRFCGLDFMNYRPRFLDPTVFMERQVELAALGLKSMMYGGEGEPLLHRQLAEMIEHGRARGIDQALTTNGVLLTPDLAARILPHTQWIKISLDAGTSKTYAALHGTDPRDFEKVLANLAAAADLRSRRGYTCTLGTQMLLLPENAAEAVTLAGLVRGAGADYLVIKPYSAHPQSRHGDYRDLRYEGYLPLAEELAALNTDSFSVIFRVRTMRKWDQGGHPYRRCLALPFWTYVDAGGNVWGCSMFLGDEKFLYGNIHQRSFQEIWEGEARTRHLKLMAEQHDTSSCRVNCRLDEVNRYLWDLQNPPPHVNFI